MSVSTLNPKVLEEAKSPVLPAENLKEQAGKGEYTTPLAASGEPAALTQAEQALQFFTNRVEQIPGVIRTRRYRIARSNEEGVMVIVASLFSPITHEVIRVQELVYDAMPGIRFPLDIKDASTTENKDE